MLFRYLILVVFTEIYLRLAIFGSCEKLNSIFELDKVKVEFNFAISSLFTQKLGRKEKMRTSESHRLKLSVQNKMQSRGKRRLRRSNMISSAYSGDSKPHFIYTPIEQTVSPGSPVSIKCSAGGFPDPVVTWIKDGRDIIPTSRMAVTFESYGREMLSFVNISNAITRDGGQYTCIASNRVGSTRYSTRLNVYGPPFIRPMKNITVVAREPTQIWCPAGGYPVPAVTWQFKGKEIATNSRYKLLSNNTLLIRQVVNRDEGRYSCIATGRRGASAVGTMYASVKNPPEIEEFHFSKALVKGKRTFVTCMINSGDPPLTIQWLKNGQPLSHDPDVEQDLKSEYSKSLLFKKLMERHSGDYTCMASNSAATSNRTATLTVKVPPMFVVEPSDINARVGSAATIECQVRGVPKPVIKWSKSSSRDTIRDFKPLVFHRKKFNIEESSIVFHHLEKSDAGAYRCEADNDIGNSISRVIIMNVNAGASIISESKVVSAHVNREATIECLVEGDQPITITWKKDYNIVVPSKRVSIELMRVSENSVKSSLLIRDLRSFDKGDYTCEAKNNHGRQSKNFSLLIYEPPSPPKDVIIESVGSRTAHVSWSVEPHTDVILNYKKREDLSWKSRGQNISVPHGSSFYVLQSLKPYSKYAVSLYGRNDLGISQPSQTVSFTTLEEAPSDPPQDIQINVVDSHTLYVEWSSPPLQSINGELRGYQIGLKEQNIAEPITYVTRPVNNLDGKEYYTVTNLKSNQLYEVSVRGFNKMGVGPLSTPRIIQKTMIDVPLCKPAGVGCRSDSSSTVRVWWQTPPPVCQNSVVQEYSIVGIATQYSFNSNKASASESVYHEVMTTNLEKSVGDFPPFTNVTIYVRGANSVGYSAPSDPVFCTTEVNAIPVRLDGVRAVSSLEGPAFIAWNGVGNDEHGILRYTIYYEQDGQVYSVRIPITGRSKTWKYLHGFKSGDKVLFWVTASSTTGESPPSSKVPLRFTGATGYGPVSISYPPLVRTLHGNGVTLNCLGFGVPPPSTQWQMNGNNVFSDQHHQFLPGGDLHTIATKSLNYTCRAVSSSGIDESTVQVVILKKPSIPLLRVLDSTHRSINVSIHSEENGGLPVLGYTIYYKESSGEWLEVKISPNSYGRTGVTTLSSLKCSSNLKLYGTSWNAQGSSQPSSTSIASTKGSSPPKPQSNRIIELNATCIIFRLYQWPENGCAIQKWNIELKVDDESHWNMLYEDIQKDARDLFFCDILPTQQYFVQISAFIESASTTVAYNIYFSNKNHGSLNEGIVQEVGLYPDSEVYKSFFSVHSIAYALSAIIFASSIVVCYCAVYKKRNYDKTNISVEHTVKPIVGSTLSYDIYSDEDKGNPYIQSASIHKNLPTEPKTFKTFNDDVYQYAANLGEKHKDTLQYGLTVRSNSPIVRDCYEGQPGAEELYSSNRDAYFSTGIIRKPNCSNMMSLPIHDMQLDMPAPQMVELYRPGKQKKHRSKSRLRGASNDEMQKPPTYTEARTGRTPQIE